MRHNKNFNHLGRQAGHRKAMLSNMASSLILHKRIETTVAKAKAVRQFIDISGQAVHVRPAAGSGMITENYLRLNIGLSFNETWFDKWKVQ